MTRDARRPDTLGGMSNDLAGTITAVPSRRTPFDPNAEAVVLRSIEIMNGGSLEDFHELIHPHCVNHEAKAEPPATRGRGPEAMYATALWLQAAYADLRWEIHEVVVERDLVAVHCTMSGRHVGDFVTYTEDGAVGEVFPRTRAHFFEFSFRSMGPSYSYCTVHRWSAVVGLQVCCTTLALLARPRAARQEPDALLRTR